MGKRINDLDFQKIFNNLEEMVNLWKDKEYDYGELEALIILCDEFIVYRTILKEPFHKNYINRAVKAFLAAENLLLERLEVPEFQSQMVGMAYFAMKLDIGVRNIAFWFQAAHKRPLQIRHYSEWFRQQYFEVQMWLRNNIQ